MFLVGDTVILYIIFYVVILLLLLLLLLLITLFFIITYILYIQTEPLKEPEKKEPGEEKESSDIIIYQR